jgi:hypothetical protein
VSLANEPITPSYEAPRVTLIGSVHELTQGDFCNKTLGSADGFHFEGQAIVCKSSA